jgi:hypothetical protein
LSRWSESDTICRQLTSQIQQGLHFSFQLNTQNTNHIPLYSQYSKPLTVLQSPTPWPSTPQCFSTFCSFFLEALATELCLSTLPFVIFQVPARMSVLKWFCLGGEEKGLILPQFGRRNILNLCETLEKFNVTESPSMPSHASIYPRELCLLFHSGGSSPSLIRL